jgi:uncharacterized protein (TIGR02145 family)
MTIAFVSVSQKTKKEKIDFNKDIYPLLEVENFERAIPLMHAYYNQNLLMGDIWRPKVILLESNTMFYTQKILGDDYYKKAANSGSQLYIDSSRIWYNRMIANLNPDSNYAKQQLKLIQQNEYSWKLEGPKKAQRLKEEQEKQRQQEAQKLAEETRKKNEERIEAENREKEIAERKRKDELAKQKEEQERAEAIKYKSVFKSIDSLIVIELPKLTSIELCNSFVTKLEKYKTERNVKTQIFPLDNEVNGQTAESGQSAIVAASIPNLEKLLNKRDKLIFEELKKQTTLELTSAFLLKQFLFENNIASAQGREKYFIEKINKRVLFNLDATANGLVFYAKMFSEEEDGIYNKIIKMNYSSGQINKIIYTDGSVYTGETNDVYPNGSGKVVLGTEGSIFGIDNDKVASFEGGFNLGYISEFGILKFKDKSVYEGANSNGVPNGKGKLTSATGVVQDGDFVDGAYKKSFSCKTAVIGNQTWMAENLSVITFANGDPIFEAKSAEEWRIAGEKKKAAYCYVNNDPSTASKYGVLYNWYAMNDKRGLAPEGWRIPKENDFQILKFMSENELNTIKKQIDDLNNQGVSSSDVSQKYTAMRKSYKSKENLTVMSTNWGGTKLKSKTGWEKNTNLKFDSNGTDVYGFNAKPSFQRSMMGQYESYNQACFWTSDYKFDSDINEYNFVYINLCGCFGAMSDDNFRFETISPEYGFNVRCIKK